MTGPISDAVIPRTIPPYIIKVSITSDVKDMNLTSLRNAISVTEAYTAAPVKSQNCTRSPT